MSLIKRVPVARVTEELTTFLANPDAQPFVLTRKGKAVAVVYRCDDEDDLDHIAWARSPRLREIVARSEAEIRAGKGIPHDEFWKLVEADTKTRDVKKVRKKMKVKVRT